MLGLVSNFSMFPLLSRDGLALPYLVLSALLFGFSGIVSRDEAPTRRPAVARAVIGGVLLLHASALVVRARKGRIL